MKLSFIVSAFNRPARLRTCLASLVDQSFTDWEAIVVDNSNALSARQDHQELCQLDPRIRYEFTGDRTFDANLGRFSLYTATEIGVQMAAGKWICFPNDDSYYVPAFAERMLAQAESDNLGFVYCDIVFERPNAGYGSLSCAPHNCAIDKTCFALKREWFQGFPMKSEMYAIADGLFVESLVERGIRHGRVPQILVVHN